MIKVFTLILVSFSSHLAFSQEGVSTQIDAARLNEVMEWVENAKYTLDTNLEDIQRSNPTDQESRYANVIETILRQSGNKPNEFLMRNILYRTKVVYASLQDIPSSPKRDVLARRVLEDGVSWAQKLYEPDMNLMKLAREGKLTEVLRGTEFAKLGIEWADYMLTLYYMAPTNKVKYRLMVDLMGLLYNDINNDDAVKRVLAPISGAIVAKHQDLQRVDNLNTVEYLSVARDLRRFVEQQIRVIKNNLNISTQRQENIESQEQALEFVSENEQILDRCNKIKVYNVRLACLAAKASAAKYTSCLHFTRNDDARAYCFQDGGVWNKYNWQKQSDVEIASSCSALTDYNSYVKCLDKKVSIERVSMCKRATKTNDELAYCLVGGGVWANY